MKLIKLFVVALFMTTLGVTGWILYLRFEGTPPSTEFIGLKEHIRATQTVEISLSDPKSGLRNAKAVLRMKGEEIPLFEKDFPSENLFLGGVVMEDRFPVEIDLTRHRLADGEAEIVVTVRDYSWRRWWNGNKTELTRAVSIDTKHPTIRILSRQHNIRQGGSGMVIYELSEPCERSGVTVGETFFPGYPADAVLGAGASRPYIAMIALNHKQGRGTPIQAVAVDKAGNESQAGFYYYIRDRNFRQDTIRISDSFLNQTIPEFEPILAGHHESQIKKFLEINRAVREKNNAVLQSLSETTRPEFLWGGAFLRLPNSARRANFADRRDYVYDGETIDQQVHLGVDLASLERSPVPAANAGIVIFADDIGIFGTTVAIDHGFGLISTYSHLSSVDVEAGQRVAKGDTIGRTGTTGLAGGDHLHFGMMVHNTFVTPVEWWDPKWINDNIMLKVEEAKAALSGERS